jgi:hypothetical protein
MTTVKLQYNFKLQKRDLNLLLANYLYMTVRSFYSFALQQPTYVPCTCGLWRLKSSKARQGKATMAMATTTHQNDHDRVLVHIPLPAGILGVNISDPVPQFESNNHVWVLSVKANSPLLAGSSGSSKLETGDWIVSINECDVHGQVASFCLGILAATVKSTTRKMVVLRSRTPQRFIYQEEDTDVNTTKTTNNQATATAMSTVDAPLTTTTTATTTTKRPPSLQPSDPSKRVGDKPEKKKKKQQQPKHKPQRKQAPLPTNSILQVAPPIRAGFQLEPPALGDTTQDMLYHRCTFQLQGLMDLYTEAEESWQTRKVQLESTIAQLEARIATAKRNHDAGHPPTINHGVPGRNLLPLETPTPSGSNTTDRRQPYQGKTSGLPFDIQQNLLHHIEGPATRHMKCHTICNLRPDLYGVPGSKLRRAVQNKSQWFRKLKETDPKEYWKMVPDHSSFGEQKVESSARINPDSVAKAPEKPAAADRANSSSSDDDEEESDGMDQESDADAP